MYKRQRLELVSQVGVGPAAPKPPPACAGAVSSILLCHKLVDHVKILEKGPLTRHLKTLELDWWWLQHVDVMKLQIQVDERGRPWIPRFKRFGCGSAMASRWLAIE